MPIAWRITKTKRVASAFDGEGARRSGGRWNSVGTPMVYTSATIALASLQVLVHLEDSSVLPYYSVLPVEFDESLMRWLDVTTLPANWLDPMTPIALQQIGDAWAKARESVVLRVPSVIVSSEDNYLLNPAHPDFTLLKFGPAQPFDFDSRLLKAPVQ
jgi:RES domain-containing protein